MRRNFIGKQNKEFWFSVVAILISIVSLWKSCQSTEIAQKSLEVDIQPILRCEFIPRHGSVEVSIQNDGLSSIDSISIFGDVFTVIIESRVVGGHLKLRGPWNSISTLSPKERKVFLIDSSECGRFFGMKRFYGHPDSTWRDSILGVASSLATASTVVSLSFKFRREADQKLFFARRSFVIDRWPSDDDRFIQDLDEPVFDYYYGIRDVVEHYFDSLQYKSR